MEIVGDDLDRHGENPLHPSRSHCCREMQLQEFPDKYVVRSLDPDFPDLVFSVARSDGALQPLTGGDINSGIPIKVSTIFGVVGIIRLLAGTYVLVITSQKEIGTYLGCSIYGVKSMRFLSCNEALRHSTSQEKRDEAYFMSLLRTVESTPGLYYSYAMDLTVNLQRACKLTEGRLQKPLWKQADPRFVWNRSLLEELIETKLDAFVLPLIQGSFQTVQFTIKNLPAKLTLISRRCNRRLGTRMWRRGANLEGAAANFIETEQLLEFGNFRSSFLQHGDEGQLGRAYAAEVEKLPYVRYVSFDFHLICGKGNFDNLQMLYEQISETVENQGYFLTNDVGGILLEQNGIIRANCIDCLDRTNVTQSYLACKSLTSQLRQMGAFSSIECISMHPDIYEQFKILWAEHGDEISLEYAGTHALKGDLVRYGRQTVSGLIKDGMSALSRYYLNNFQDGIRQDALDLISGHYSIRRDGPSPFQLNGFETFSYLPIASALVVGGLTMTTFTLNQAGRNAHHFVSTVLWAGLAAGVAAIVKANGKQFCSRPRLCGLL